MPVEPTAARPVLADVPAFGDPSLKSFSASFVRGVVLCVGTLCLIASAGNLLTFLYYLQFEPAVVHQAASWYLVLSVVREVCALAACAMIVRGSLPTTLMARWSPKWVRVGAAILLANALLSLVLTWTLSLAGAGPVKGGTWIYLSGSQVVRLLIQLMPVAAVFWLAPELDGRGAGVIEEGGTE
jgi:hypothetical protein